jgi:hypothetical protein
LREKYNRGKRACQSGNAAGVIFLADFDDLCYSIPESNSQEKEQAYFEP